MNEEDQLLETLLREMPLREPSLNLDARMNDLFQHRQLQRPRRNLFYLNAIAAGLLIAAGVGIYFFKTKPLVNPIAVAPISHPVRIERDTSTVFDEGVIANIGDAAYQQFRRRTVCEIWYVDPRTHARAQITIPIDQVLIQKVDNY